MQDLDALGRFASLLTVLDALQNAKERRLLSEKTFIPSPSQAVYRGMKMTIDVILNRFNEPLTMAEMLHLSGMSKATFARQFRKHTGRTFTQFLNEVRIEHACRQLLDTEASVSEIAYDSGFVSLSHFNHCFQALRNVNPRHYRHQKTGPR